MCSSTRFNKDLFISRFLIKFYGIFKMGSNIKLQFQVYHILVDITISWLMDNTF